MSRLSTVPILAYARVSYAFIWTPHFLRVIQHKICVINTAYVPLRMHTQNFSVSSLSLCTAVVHRLHRPQSVTYIALELG